jgi:hypothetical protein
MAVKGALELLLDKQPANSMSLLVPDQSPRND